MALFEKKKDDKKSYIALLNDKGDVIAFIHPIKNLDQELLVERLREKELTVEIRESADAMTELRL